MFRGTVSHTQSLELSGSGLVHGMLCLVIAICACSRLTVDASMDVLFNGRGFDLFVERCCDVFGFADVCRIYGTGW